MAPAEEAGLCAILNELAASAAGGKKAASEEEVKAPPEKVVTAEIPGIEILELEDAVRAVWKAGIYATSGMGCTGPILLVAPEDKDAALAALKEAGYL